MYRESFLAQGTDWRIRHVLVQKYFHLAPVSQMG